MVRTLETATGAFGAGLPQGPANVMMTSLEPREQWQAGHPAVALPPGIPVISHEGCRERVSKLSCKSCEPLYLGNHKVHAALQGCQLCACWSDIMLTCMLCGGIGATYGVSYSVWTGSNSWLINITHVCAGDAC